MAKEVRTMPRPRGVWLLLSCILLSSMQTVQTDLRAQTLLISQERSVSPVDHERPGVLPRDHSLAMRVRGVFEKILRASGRRPGVVPAVAVLDTPRVIALSYSHGRVEVSRALVELLGDDDAGLAFVLAHEVAHVVLNHHALLSTMAVGRIAAGEPGRPDAEAVRTHQVAELEADRLGALFAMLAGYRPGSALAALRRVTEQTGPDPLHPDPRQRAATLDERITEVMSALEVLNLGVVWLAAGLPLNAAQVFEFLLSQFPSREVHLAAGVAYHREASRWRPVPEYRHALVVDGVRRTRGVGSPEMAREFLDRAVHHYRLAADMDAHYAPPHSNLAAAYIDQGARARAAASVKDALDLDPALASAYNNRGLLALLAGDKRAAERDFAAAWSFAPRLATAGLNLARLYRSEGRESDARRVEAEAEALPSRAPHGHRDGFQQSLGEVVLGAPASQLASWAQERGTRSFPLDVWEVKLSGGQVTKSNARSRLAVLVAARRGLVVVARAGVIEAVGTLPGSPVVGPQGLRVRDSVERVATLYGHPEAVEGLQTLRVWVYASRGLAVFLSRDHVDAVWMWR